MSHGVFREIERLIEYIPIEIDTYGIGNSYNSFIDSRYNFKDIDRIATRLGILELIKNTVSIRDIIELLNKFSKRKDENQWNPLDAIGKSKIVSLVFH